MTHLRHLPAHVLAVLDAARMLAVEKPDVVAIALVGSWGRGAGRPDSDVDLVVLTHRPTPLLETDDWYQVFGPQAVLVRSADFGAIQERRLRLPGGLEVEIGVGSPSWADSDPVDPGTRRVVLDGLVPLYDPAHLLAGLIPAVAPMAQSARPLTDVDVAWRTPT